MTSFGNQSVTKKMLKKCFWIWSVQIKAVILQPFSRKAQASVSNERGLATMTSFGNQSVTKKMRKKVLENLVSSNKSSNFAAAFEKTKPLGVENKEAPSKWSLKD